MCPDDTEKEYPDNSELHARKAQWRKEQARLSFAEKLDILDRMREDAAPFLRAQERRKAERDGG